MENVRDVDWSVIFGWGESSGEFVVAVANTASPNYDYSRQSFVRPMRRLSWMGFRM
jgi:hypothetical protein